MDKKLLGKRAVKKNSLIIDTGFWIALFSQQDNWHKKTEALKPKLARLRWYTTWPVLTEVAHMLGSKMSAAFLGILALYESGGLVVFDLKPVHITRLGALIEKYRDLPMDLADASLVLLAEELGTGNIVSTDERDFGVYRFKN